MHLEPGSDEGGSALVIVLTVIAALFILGGALSIVTLSECLIAHNQEQDAKLYYITEAGIEAGVAALSCSYDYCGPISGDICGGSYSTQFVQEPGLAEGHAYCTRIPQRLATGQRLVISTGNLEGRSMVMAVIVEMAGETVASISPQIFDDMPDEFGSEGVVIVEWFEPWRV